MAGRRVALSSLASAPVEEVPGHSTPTSARLAPGQIAPTPLNKRTNFGTPDELAELGESIRRRQLAAVVVVPRARYLALFPEHEVRIGAAPYVLVNGERRWRAASQVDLPGLDAMIREDFDSRVDLLDAVAAENIHRLNLDPIEEALTVEELVTESGSASAAAEQLQRSEGWVSQRRALLRLTPEIQARVQAGEVPVRIARSIASVPAEDQETALQEAVGRQTAERVSRRTKPRGQDPEAKTAGPGPGPGTAGPGPGPGTAGPGPGPGTSAQPAPQPGPADRARAASPPPAASSTVATGTPDTADDGSGVDLPWNSPVTLAELIRSRLTAENLAELLRLLTA